MKNKIDNKVTKKINKMENLKRVEVIGSVLDYMKDHNYHVEQHQVTKNRLLVSEDRLNWIPFSKNARKVEDKADRRRLVVANYQNEDGEEFLLVCLPGELNTNSIRQL